MEDRKLYLIQKKKNVEWSMMLSQQFYWLETVIWFEENIGGKMKLKGKKMQQSLGHEPGNLYHGSFTHVIT